MIDHNAVQFTDVHHETEPIHPNNRAGNTGRPAAGLHSYHSRFIPPAICNRYSKARTANLTFLISYKRTPGEGKNGSAFNFARSQPPGVGWLVALPSRRNNFLTPIVLRAQPPMCHTRQAVFCRELPKKRRRTEVSASVQQLAALMPLGRQNPLDIDLGRLSRVPMAPACRAHWRAS